jgi:hypothetical protein
MPAQQKRGRRGELRCVLLLQRDRPPVLSHMEQHMPQSIWPTI